MKQKLLNTYTFVKNYEPNRLYLANASTVLACAGALLLCFSNLDVKEHHALSVIMSFGITLGYFLPIYVREKLEA